MLDGLFALCFYACKNTKIACFGAGRAPKAVLIIHNYKSLRAVLPRGLFNSSVAGLDAPFAGPPKRSQREWANTRAEPARRGVRRI